MHKGDKIDLKKPAIIIIKHPYGEKYSNKWKTFFTCFYYLN